MSDNQSTKTAEPYLRLGYILIAVSFLVYMIELSLAPGPSWLVIPLALFVCAIASFRHYFSTVKKTENQPAKKTENFSLYLGYGLVAAAFFVFVLGWSFSLSLGLFVCGIGSFLYYFSTAKNEK
jgi:hypothetical protein